MGYKDGKESLRTAFHKIRFKFSKVDGRKFLLERYDTILIIVFCDISALFLTAWIDV